MDIFFLCSRQTLTFRLMHQLLVIIASSNSKGPPVAEAAIHSEAVALLLLIYCFMCLPLFVGFCVDLCFFMHYFESFLVLQSS